MMGEFNSQMLNEPVPIWFAANFAKQQQKPDEDRIYAAFGRFVASYALAKSALHIAARHFSGMPDDKARVVFSGMRQADIIDRLRSLIPSDKTDEVSQLLSQFSHITVARNQFVHRLVNTSMVKDYLLQISSRVNRQQTKNLDYSRCRSWSFWNMIAA